MANPNDITCAAIARQPSKPDPEISSLTIAAGSKNELSSETPRGEIVLMVIDGKSRWEYFSPYGLPPYPETIILQKLFNDELSNDQLAQWQCLQKYSERLGELEHQRRCFEILNKEDQELCSPLFREE